MRASSLSPDARPVAIGLQAVAAMPRRRQAATTFDWSRIGVIFDLLGHQGWLESFTARWSRGAVKLETPVTAKRESVGPGTSGTRL
jgi:hypothetical protein